MFSNGVEMDQSQRLRNKLWKNNKEVQQNGRQNKEKTTDILLKVLTARRQKMIEKKAKIFWLEKLQLQTTVRID
jgi:hypothetical protein